MEPLPETAEALAEFDMLEEPDPEELLDRLQVALRRLVPQLVGLSLSLVRDRLTFTVVASDADVAGLDATQYLDEGPCVDVAAEREEAVSLATEDPMDEERWQLFAKASAAQGVASTLSLPLYGDGSVIGSVNLYASTRDAFSGRIEQIALVVGALPSEGVMNADLSFTTRQEAAAAPQRLRDRHIIETAVGLVAGDKDIDLRRAREELVEAAARAGVRLAQLTRVVVQAYKQREG